MDLGVLSSVFYFLECLDPSLMLQFLHAGLAIVPVPHTKLLPVLIDIDEQNKPRTLYGSKNIPKVID